MTTTQTNGRWPTVPLAELMLDAANGLASGERDPQGTLQIRMNNVGTDGSLDLIDVIRIPASSAQISRYCLQSGDVLFNNTNSTELVGKSTLFPGHDEPVLFSNHFTRLRTNRDRLHPSYLARWLTGQQQSQVFAHLCNRWVNQSAVRKEALLGLSIPLPPLPEQKRIAAILDQADAMRRKRRQVMDCAADVIPAVFHNMFGSAVANERGWDVVKVSDAGEVLLGRQRAPKYQSGEHTTPYMRVANVFEDRIDTSDVLSMDFGPKDFARFELANGDILLNEGQSTELVGRAAIWRGEIQDCCFQNTLVRFRAYRNRTEPEYALSVFLQYLHAGEFAKVSSKTSSVAHLGAGRFGKMPFPLPPFDLQQAFARRVDAARVLRTRCREASGESHELFDSLVQRAFGGKL